LIPLTLCFQKAFPKASETCPRNSRFRLALREPRSEQESLPTISNLGSWNGLLTHLPAGFISATASAFALRNSAALTFDLVLNGRPAYPWGPAWSLTRRFCASSVPAHRPTLRFSRDILVPTTGVCESCSLSGASPSIGSCALRPEQLQVYRSVNFCASSSRSVTWRTFPRKSYATHHPVCLQNSPPESRWATSPPRKMALGPLQASHWPPKCPLRSGPAGCASLIEVFNHRRTFAALLRLAAQVRTPSIEQSAYQTYSPAKSLQIRARQRSTYPKPEKLSSSAPFFGRTRNHKSEFW